MLLFSKGSHTYIRFSTSYFNAFDLDGMMEVNKQKKILFSRLLSHAVHIYYVVGPC